LRVGADVPSSSALAASIFSVVVGPVASLISALLDRAPALPATALLLVADLLFWAVGSALYLDVEGQGRGTLVALLQRLKTCRSPTAPPPDPPASDAAAATGLAQQVRPPPAPPAEPWAVALLAATSHQAADTVVAHLAPTVAAIRHRQWDTPASCRSFSFLLLL
jgi:hypothetical protein